MTKRTTPLPEPDFQPRDERIFTDIYERRGLTALQISALHYPLDARPEERIFPIEKRHSNCEYRLLQLHHHGYLERHEQPERPSRGRKDLIYLLSRKGVRLLTKWLGLSASDMPYYTYDPEASDNFFDHLVLRNNFWIALKLASDKKGTTIVTWLTEHYFRRKSLKVPLGHGSTGDRTKPAGLQPDDYFHLQTEQVNNSNYHRFVEIDRGKETVNSRDERYKSWKHKIELYTTYYDSGKYFERFGAKGMAVLTVTTTQTRLQNLIRATEQAGGGGRFWFTTFDKVTSETVLSGKIWNIAGGRQDDLRSLLFE